MKNKVIDVCRIKKLNLVSVTVENADFSNSKPGKAVKIGNKNYIFDNIVLGRGLKELDTFNITYTDDDLIGKQVVFA